MSIRVLLRDHPYRSIALVTESHALVFRHTASTQDAISNGSLTSIHSSAASRVSLDGGSGNNSNNNNGDGLGGNTSTQTARCMVEFAPTSAIDLSEFRSLSPMPVHGTLGLITVQRDIFLCVVGGSTRVATVRPGETVERIFNVNFYCLNSARFDLTQGPSPDFPLNPYEYDHNDVYAQSTSYRDPPLEHPCGDLEKLLGDGSFYYSTDFDLTSRLQDRSVEAATFDIDNLDESFLWNSYMISPLVKFRSRLVSQERDALDQSRILTSAIRGFVLTVTVPASSAPLRTSKTGLPSNLTLISRLSCRRAGTRFNSRGIDDDGNVANFVESETIFWSPTGSSNSEKPPGICFSYSQIRGSVPVFWEQAPGLIPGQQKISITRSSEGTQPAFDKHFGELEQNYGPVHVVNLLSEKPGEAELTNLYRIGVRHSSLNRRSGKSDHDHDLLRETEYDFHAETKGPNGYEAASMIRHLIEASAVGFAYYLVEETEDPAYQGTKTRSRSVVKIQQEGVFRTNCLDCLDRTNLIQTIISQMAAEMFLEQMRAVAPPDFWMRHSTVWADNGDALSKIYAGTGALKSSFTRTGKMSLAGAFADARKSATRLYINNFADKGRQNTIDVLLGRMMGQQPVHLFDPINDYVTAQLAKRSSEFQASEVLHLYVGTFNLNGKTKGIDEDLSSWLCPLLGPDEAEPDIVAIGFQEIVELTAQQIMNSDPTRKGAWEKAALRTLNRHKRPGQSNQYILLRSGQLVGAALCIFVKASQLQNIKNVEGSIKKTGMSGIAGNKGAVGIRMDYANTQICFVTAHLAAGFSNYEERNKDYETIQHGLRFQRNRRIDDHDTVIWMGDFNYRIGLNNEMARQLIKQGDLNQLYENDQLNVQMVHGKVFEYYEEARITFNPTYKFDLGADSYDTSEKGRIPAWTDRILHKGSNLRQMAYNSAPLRFSDHRPVYATFQCTVSIVNEAIREALSREIYHKRRIDVGRTTASQEANDSDDEDLIGYDPIEPGLPPASSDQRKWWLDNGVPGRSSLLPPTEGAVPNPHRPSNPFSPTDEPDWVTVPSMGSTSRRPVPEVVNTTFAPPPPNPRPLTDNPRKLPPPVNNLPLISLPRTTENGSSDRRSDSISSTSSSKKAPPVVARKPIHLTSAPSSTSASPTISADGGPLPPKRSATGFSSHITVDFPPPPRTATYMQPQTYTQPQQPQSQPLPPPPPRRPINGGVSSTPSYLSASAAATAAAAAAAAKIGARTNSSVSTASNSASRPHPQTRRTNSRYADDSDDDGDQIDGADDSGRRPALPRRPVDLMADDGPEGSDGMGGWVTLKPS